MKIDESLRAPGAPDDVVESDLRTRIRVQRMILERGPVTAAELAAGLGLTAAAVRRHLDVLLSEGHVSVWEAPAARQRGRGRPARQFVVTDDGHETMASGYAEMAASALGFVRELGGPQAVRRVADERVAALEERYRPDLEAAGEDPVRRAQVLASRLSADGYAASTRPVELRGTTLGVQLCQGHCPVQHVAREFPELCEAETDAFSRLLGVHVQRLATLAHGEHVCTTHVPNATPTTERQPE